MIFEPNLKFIVAQKANIHDNCNLTALFIESECFLLYWRENQKKAAIITGQNIFKYFRAKMFIINIVPNDSSL